MSRTLRFRTEDFLSRRHSGGGTPGWPFSYERLRPYYERAERLLHVHGLKGSDPTEPDRDGFPCMVRAKLDAENAILRPMLLKKPGNLTLWTGAMVRRLETDSSGDRVIRAEVDKEGERIHLLRKGTNTEAHEALLDQAKRIMKRAGYPICIVDRRRIRAIQHQCGTIRFGNDPRTADDRRPGPAGFRASQGPDHRCRLAGADPVGAKYSRSAPSRSARGWPRGWATTWPTGGPTGERP